MQSLIIKDFKNYAIILKNFNEQINISIGSYTVCLK